MRLFCRFNNYNKASLCLTLPDVLAHAAKQFIYAIKTITFFVVYYENIWLRVSTNYVVILRPHEQAKQNYNCKFNSGSE